MGIPDTTLDWLLEGDHAIRWQAMRDLCDAPPGEWQLAQACVATEGWGAALLALQATDGAWGNGLYSPKWTSTFYTLLLLRDLGLPAEHEAGCRAASLLLETGFRPRDGGLDYGGNRKTSETCVTGMGLAMLARFGAEDERIHAIRDHLLREQMLDGGWNCQRPRGATHASFHTTISALEGLREYAARFAPAPDVVEAEERGREFLLAHRLFRSHSTGDVVSDQMTRFHFPARWHYDVLRGLDHFREARAPFDPRLEDAIALVRARQRSDGRWNTAAPYAGRVHFVVEPAGQPGRMVTLRCLRVLRWWESLQPETT